MCQEQFLEEPNKELINIALRYLCLREYSEKELQKKINNKQSFTEDEFEKAFRYLREKNYLSLERYIRQKANNLKIKGFSTNYIIQFFNTENISVTKDEIEQLELQSDMELIKHLILKKYHACELESLPIKKMNSLIRHICSKGHSYHDIKSTINSMKSDL